jgi:hypothetical protein
MAIALQVSNAHLGQMSNQTPRATTRPANFARPDHWTTDPAPTPKAAEHRDDPDGIDPTRFGDWEKNGIAIDF